MFVILQKYDFSSKSQLMVLILVNLIDVCDTAKVRFFKQITTTIIFIANIFRCLWYCKSTIFQANHNYYVYNIIRAQMFVILQKYDFSSKSQPMLSDVSVGEWCLWYCKSTIFQANHNRPCTRSADCKDVCDTAKVRFFKQITTILIGFVSWKRCLWYCKSTIFQANHNQQRTCLHRSRDVCDTAKVRFFKQITTFTLSLRAM